MSILFFLLTLTSCATLFSDSSDEVKITSEPEGAAVYIEGNKVGVTPLKIQVRRETFVNKTAMLKMQGYETHQFRLAKTLNNTSLFNTTSLLSWGTDALSGKLIIYSPKSYYIELEKKDVSEVKKVEDAFYFAVVNYEAIRNDLAKGDGEYLSTFYDKEKGASKGYESFLNKVKSNSKELLSIEYADVLAKKLKTLL